MKTDLQTQESTPLPEILRDKLLPLRSNEGQTGLAYAKGSYFGDYKSPVNNNRMAYPVQPLTAIVGAYSNQQGIH